jgi:hypothetical protein
MHKCKDIQKKTVMNQFLKNANTLYKILGVCDFHRRVYGWGKHTPLGAIW